MAIKNLRVKILQVRLPIIGNIKIGEKGATRKSQSGGEYQLPTKLKHFKVTTLERGLDNNFIIDEEAVELYGKEPTVLPVRLLYDDPDLSIQTRLACYVGVKAWCVGDGETASRIKGQGPDRMDVTCPCERITPDYVGSDKCKIALKGIFVLDGLSRVGGVHCFRSTSWNTASGMLSSADFVRGLTGGPLAGLPLQLSLRHKDTVIPGGKEAGKKTVIPIVSLEYAGSVRNLRQIAHDVAAENALYGARMRAIEAQARLMIEHEVLEVRDLTPDEAAEEMANTGDVIDVEEVTDKEGAKDQAAGSPVTPEPPKGRKRLVSWPDADPKLFGHGFASCGATLEQLTTLLALQNGDATGEKKKVVDQYMAENLAPTQQRTSYLREDEIQWLIDELSVAPEDAAGEDVGIVGNLAVADGHAGADERQEEPPAGVGDDDGFPMAE